MPGSLVHPIRIQFRVLLSGDRSAVFPFDCAPRSRCSPRKLIPSLWTCLSSWWRVTTLPERGARKIFLRHDSHFSRLTVVEGREITAAHLSGISVLLIGPARALPVLSLVGWQKSRSGQLVISHFPKQRHRQAAPVSAPSRFLPRPPDACHLSLALSTYSLLCPASFLFPSATPLLFSAALCRVSIPATLSDG